MFDDLTLNELVALDTEMWRAQEGIRRRYNLPYLSAATAPAELHGVMADLGDIRQALNTAMFNRPVRALTSWIEGTA